jgi:clan AA aspartic protease
MMTGSVASLRAIIPIPFRLPGQPDLTIEFVIDTGFTGALSLPLASVAAMGLPYLEDTLANLANDVSVPLPVHTATIVWAGAERIVRVIAVGRRPLLGTALLDQNHLGIDFLEGGGVTVAPCSP